MHFLGGQTKMTYKYRPEMTLRRSLALLVLGSVLTPAIAQAAETNSLLATWFARQPNIQTWSADVLQTRALKSLTLPLTATGHVWFAEPNRFRWEIGHPP